MHVCVCIYITYWHPYVYIHVNIYCLTLWLSGIKHMTAYRAFITFFSFTPKALKKPIQ